MNPKLRWILREARVTARELGPLATLWLILIIWLRHRVE